MRRRITRMWRVEAGATAIMGPRRLRPAGSSSARMDGGLETGRPGRAEPTAGAVRGPRRSGAPPARSAPGSAPGSAGASPRPRGERPSAPTLPRGVGDLRRRPPSDAAGGHRPTGHGPRRGTERADPRAQPPRRVPPGGGDRPARTRRNRGPARGLTGVLGPDRSTLAPCPVKSPTIGHHLDLHPGFRRSGRRRGGREGPSRARGRLRRPFPRRLHPERRREIGARRIARRLGDGHAGRAIDRGDSNQAGRRRPIGPGRGPPRNIAVAGRLARRLRVHARPAYPAGRSRATRASAPGRAERWTDGAAVPDAAAGGRNRPAQFAFVLSL